MGSPKAKVLLIGGHNLGQSLRSTERGFARIGCETRHVPTRGTPGAADHAKTVDAVCRAVDEFKPDIAFWWMCKSDCPAGIVHYMKAHRRDIVTVCHSFDDPFEFDTSGAPWAGQFDAVVTCCEATVARYKALGVKRAICLYPPCDVDLHPKAEIRPEYECAFAFVGTNVYPREKYPHVLVERRDVAREVDALGMLHLYGHWDRYCNGWGNAVWGAPELQHCYRNWAQFDDLPHIYRSAKINLCTHVRPDGYKYLNERVIGVMASGGFLLTDAVNGIGDIFQVGKELDTFVSIYELVVKARYWLLHDEERAAVALAGQKAVLERFNNVVYAEAVLNLCGRA